MKRKMTLTIETHQVQIFRPRPRPFTIWCGMCEAITERLSPEQAAQQLRLRPRWLYRQLEAAQLSFVETNEGTPLVCIPCVTKTNISTAIDASQRN